MEKNEIKQHFVPIDLYNKKFDEILDRIHETYPKACILWIDENVNDHLFAQFLQAQNENTPKLQLFHGTSLICIESITQEGFKADRNVASTFGKGSYFTHNANYSVNYTKPDISKPTSQISYMFLADGRPKVAIPFRP